MALLVYNRGQDWRDKKTDRARAAYDNFIELDGNFDDNVILQIKNGPMDFQVSEPVSTVVGGKKKTNMDFGSGEIALGIHRHSQIDFCVNCSPMWPVKSCILLIRMLLAKDQTRARKL